MEKKVINQKEYLKKYLSSGDVDEKKKKKKKKPKFGSQKVKIIDDDIDLKNLRPIQENEFDIFINSEDAPQIVGVVDDRGPVDFSDKKKWRIMADDDDGELQFTHNQSSKRSGGNFKSARDVSDGESSSPRLLKTVQERDIANKKADKDEDSDLSPPRKTAKGHKNRTVDEDSDLSPPRKTTKGHKSRTIDEDSDLSPPRRTAKGHKSRTVAGSDSENDSDSNVEAYKKRKAQKKRRYQRADDSDIEDSRRHQRRNQTTHNAQDKKSYHIDSDLSPPRRKPTRSQSNSDSDVSLPRSMGHRQQRNHKRDISPSRKNNHSRNNSSNDYLPKTKSDKHRRNNNFDSNSPRRHDKRHKKDSDSNHSPPRRKDRTSKNDSDLDPSRHKKKGHQYQRDSDSDLSPPRKSGRKQKYSDAGSDSQAESKIVKDSHKSRKERYESWSDQEKSHRRNDSGSARQSKYVDADYNSARKQKRYYDDSSPRRDRENTHAKYKHAQNNESEKGSSRHRKHDKDRKHQTDDRRRRKHSEKTEQNTSTDSDLSPARKRCRDTDRNASPPAVSEDNYVANAVSEKERRKHEDGGSTRHRTDRSRSEKPSKQRNSVSREDSPEHREKKMKKTLDGKTAGLQDAKALREETEAHKRREAEQFNKLSKEISGRGKAAIVRDTKTGRKRDLEAEAAEEREKQKRQDELNEKYAKWGKGLKQVEDHAERLKDDIYEMSKPLARYADDVDLDRKLREQEREGDPMLDYIKQKQVKEGKRKPDRLEYQGTFMPNRFGIKPGHRWDGVDRSNGYEKKWFEARNARVALQEDAYKWSTADM